MQNLTERKTGNPFIKYIFHEYLYARNMFNTKFLRRVQAVASVVHRMRL